jgi:opacity protein-like surface antigen
VKNSIFAVFIGVLILCSTSVQNFSQKLAEADKGGAAAADKDSKSEEKSKGLIERNWQLRRGAIERAVEHGNAPFNPSNFAGPKEYDVYGRDLYQANVRFGRVIGTKKGVTYQYLFGATPFALFTRNEVKNPAYISENETPRVAPTVRRKTYGVGVQPVNFRFIFLPKKRLKPYAQVGAGVLFTSRSMPVPRSTAFNLTGDFGGGVLYMLTETKAVNVGYRYFHISNGNIGGKINNPGYNANVFYFGYSFFK